MLLNYRQELNFDHVSLKMDNVHIRGMTGQIIKDTCIPSNPFVSNSRPDSSGGVAAKGQNHNTT